MRASGRPLKFLGAVIGGWALLRAAVLLPEAAFLPGLDGHIGFPSFAPRMFGHRWGMPPPPLVAGQARPPVSVAAARRESHPRDVQLALLGRISFGEPQRQARPVLVHPLLVPAPSPVALASQAPAKPLSRLSGSAWFALRGGNGPTLGPAGQLGGSQTGARLRYALGETRAFALSARISTPLQGRGAETGLGIEWRPEGSPVALLAEQRIGLDGSPGGPSVMAIGGIAPTSIVGAVAVEGYGQAGGVLRSGQVEPFADGALRVAAPVGALGKSIVSAGLGAWGGVQRDAARLDLGPSLAVSLPIGERNFRLGVDWRQRVSGDARPGSGFALSLGTDF